MTTVQCTNCGEDVKTEEPDWEDNKIYFRLTKMESYKERIDFLPESHTLCSDECVKEYMEWLVADG
jgi:hypothetical protein